MLVMKLSLSDFSKIVDPDCEQFSPPAIEKIYDFYNSYQTSQTSTGEPFMFELSEIYRWREYRTIADCVEDNRNYFNVSDVELIAKFEPNSRQQLAFVRDVLIQGSINIMTLDKGYLIRFDGE